MIGWRCLEFSDKILKLQLRIPASGCNMIG